ncbi:hypothetical protein [uncultured Jatrophihabitans sp.]|uniref:hypothetical protein n=1 Tax=uncultured Jatrophihabitans sp. TaxID=1610747 RepID=UPI0035CA2F05
MEEEQPEESSASLGREQQLRFETSVLRGGRFVALATSALTTGAGAVSAFVGFTKIGGASAVLAIIGAALAATVLATMDRWIVAGTPRERDQHPVWSLADDAWEQVVLAHHLDEK